MPSYDSIGTPFQLGGDLGVHSSNGWPYPGALGASLSSTYWDQATGPTLSQRNPADSLVDCCFHRGNLYVIWVEPAWDGFDRVPRGPYVKVWNGASWLSLGGEISGITPAGHLMQSAEPGEPDGTVYYPARPRLASDGTSLYAAYTVHVAAAEGTVGARYAIVLRWTGSTWELYGSMPPETNNTAVLGLDTSGRYSRDISLSASPAEPGVCYLAFWETGVLGTTAFSGYRFRLATGRFDGSGPAGDTKNVYEEELDPSYTSTQLATFLALLRRYGERGFSVVNGNGTGYFIWVANTLDETQMQLWSDLAVVQSGDLGSILDAVVYDAAGASYLVVNEQPTSVVRELAEDGSSGFSNLDGILGAGAIHGSFLFDPTGCDIENAVSYVPDSPSGIWAISTTAIDTTPPFGRLAHYHRQCRGWDDLGLLFRLESVDGDLLYPIGVPRMTRQGNTLYATVLLYDPGVLTADVRVVVIAIPILRNTLSCAALSIHFWDHFTVVP